MELQTTLDKFQKLVSLWGETMQNTVEVMSDLAKSQLILEEKMTHLEKAIEKLLATAQKL